MSQDVQKVTAQLSKIVAQHVAVMLHGHGLPFCMMIYDRLVASAGQEGHNDIRVNCLTKGSSYRMNE